MGKKNNKTQILFLFLRMCLSLYDCQSKASTYWKGLTCLRNRATTNQKYAINSQKTEESTSIKLNEEFQATKRKAEKKKEKGTKMKQRIN